MLDQLLQIQDLIKSNQESKLIQARAVLALLIEEQTVATKKEPEDVIKSLIRKTTQDNIMNQDPPDGLGG